MIHVVNKHFHQPTRIDVYIGRGSPLGNPYSSLSGATKAEFQSDTREESIESFEKYLLDGIARKDTAICAELNRIWRLAKLGDINLVCYCKPKSCHGDIIKRLIESKL